MITSIIKISRSINFLITFLAVVIASFISAKNGIELSNIIIAGLAMSFSFSAGNIINDIIDLEIDKINKPQRVLVQGKLSINFAKFLYAFFVFLSLILAVINGIASLLFLVIINIILLLYSFYFKKIILFGNIIVALLTASALIYGAFIVENIVAGIIPAIFAFLINFIREIIKDMEDIKGDSANNVNTFPKINGIRNTLSLILISTIVLIIFSFIPFVYNIYKIEFFIILMVIVNPLLVFMLKILFDSQELVILKKTSLILKLSMVIGLIAIFIGK